MVVHAIFLVRGGAWDFRYDYAMIIADGKVEAKIELAIYDANPAMRQLNTQSFTVFA